MKAFFLFLLTSFILVSASQAEVSFDSYEINQLGMSYNSISPQKVIVHFHPVQGPNRGVYSTHMNLWGDWETNLLYEPPVSYAYMFDLNNNLLVVPYENSLEFRTFQNGFWSEPEILRSDGPFFWPKICQHKVVYFNDTDFFVTDLNSGISTNLNFGPHGTPIGIDAYFGNTFEHFLINTKDPGSNWHTLELIVRQANSQTILVRSILDTGLISKSSPLVSTDSGKLYACWFSSLAPEFPSSLYGVSIDGLMFGGRSLLSNCSSCGYNLRGTSKGNIPYFLHYSPSSQSFLLTYLEDGEVWTTQTVCTLDFALFNYPGDITLSAENTLILSLTNANMDLLYLEEEVQIPSYIQEINFGTKNFQLFDVTGRKINSFPKNSTNIYFTKEKEKIIK